MTDQRRSDDAKREPTAGAVMHADVTIVHRHHTVAEARDRVRASDVPGVVVVDGDRVVTILAAAEIDRLASSLGGEAHLRDGVPSGARFCYADDPLEVAAATMAAAGDDLLAVVDAECRIVGLLTRESLGDAGTAARARPVVDPTDRSGAEHPKLEVYAPWAVIEGH